MYNKKEVLPKDLGNNSFSINSIINVIKKIN